MHHGSVWPQHFWPYNIYITPYHTEKTRINLFYFLEKIYNLVNKQSFTTRLCLVTFDNTHKHTLKKIVCVLFKYHKNKQQY